MQALTTTTAPPPATAWTFNLYSRTIYMKCYCNNNNTIPGACTDPSHLWSARSSSTHSDGPSPSCQMTTRLNGHCRSVLVECVGGLWFRGRKAALHVTFIRCPCIFRQWRCASDLNNNKSDTTTRLREFLMKPPSPTSTPTLLQHMKIHFYTFLINSQEDNNLNGGTNVW